MGDIFELVENEVGQDVALSKLRAYRYLHHQIQREIFPANSGVLVEIRRPSLAGGQFTSACFRAKW